MCHAELEVKLKVADATETKDQSASAKFVPTDHLSRAMLLIRISAVLRLQGMAAPVVNLVGPPGTGKTFLCGAAAKQMGMRMVR
eukprot:12724499-Heterocapsa_arctica.AAC.1